MSKKNSQNTMKKITSLLKRRGFVWQSSEIYGGAASSYDYGPLGVLVKNNLKNFWLRSMTKGEEDIVPLDSAIFMHPKVWEASGHVEHFTDPMVECGNCKRRFKQEDLSPARAGGAQAGVDGEQSFDPTQNTCPACGTKELGEARTFNLMFKTHLGPVEETASTVYLRPETAQGIYVNYALVQKAMRLKLPFGIAQVGKAFRNEITPSNFTYRTVEFEQMEMQFFVHPDNAADWFADWRDRRFAWYSEKLGIDPENLRLREHGPDELAHYARGAVDVEFNFPFGWHEVEGIHNRGDWDLARHQEFSGKDLTYYDPSTKLGAGEKVLPHIVETAAGADRVTLALLLDAYTQDEENDRTVLALNPWFTPYRVAVFPLVRKDEKLVEKARTLHTELKKHHSTAYDESGSIGRRYRRHDEIGTPWCITVDSQTLEDGTVTIRDRDLLEQVRVHKDEVNQWIEDKLQ